MNNEDHRRSEDEIESQVVGERHDQLSDDIEAIADMIDEVLEENAEEFVRSYVEKGGQGWSGFFTPEFYVGAAAAGILSGATYDIFKTVIRRITKALLQIPGRSTVRPDQAYEDMIIEEAWITASRLAAQEGIQHSIDEATALHWALFTIELEHSLGSIHLGAQRYERLVRASAATEDSLEASELGARIIDQWLEQRELHTRLRRLREIKGLTREVVAGQLDWSLPKMVRIESGASGISATDLKALLHLYGIESPQLIGEFIALSKAWRQGRFHRR